MLRHLLKDKIYLLVNVLSLSAGLICCLFVFKYIQDELSFDKFHTDADRIYRIEYEATMDDGFTSRFANLHGNVLPDWLSILPEIESKTRFAPHVDLVTKVSGELFEERNILAADSSFFHLFTFNFIEGEPASALTNPNSVVISKTTAQKYYNTTNAIGEILELQFGEQEILLTITGVVEDVPSNSHFFFDIVTSSQTFEKLYGWGIRDIQQAYNYIKISEGVSAGQLQKKMNEIHSQNESLSWLLYHLRALTDIHLHSSARGELSSNGNITYVYILSFIVLIILIIACLNFTTLATARSVNRTNEIGIRKAYGAQRGNLISSFLFESVFLAFCSLLLAFFLALKLLPLFNQLADKTITFTQLTEPAFLLSMALITIVTGCVAGIYPALILTKHKPSSLLLKNSSSGLKGGNFRKSVIIVQFTATIVLISISYTIHQQIEFIHNQDLGFDKEQIITFPNVFGERPEMFLNRLRQHPNIKHTTLSSYLPGVSKSSGTAQVSAEGTNDTITFDWISVDHHYIDTYGITLAHGRSFSEDYPSDVTQGFIINETAANLLEWEEPLGKNLNAFERDGQVIGVVEDFNFLSLHSEISPLIMIIYEPLFFTISAKIHSAEQLSETISYAENIWQDLTPGTVFTYNFVNDQFAAVYDYEQRAQSLFFVFSTLAMSIAALGLFSFASFSMRQKKREIGIRKVLGATVYDILKLFYSGYFRLLIIAFVLALPVAIFWMNHWLQNFSYRININTEIITVPVIVSVIIILISVSYQVMKEALRNPAEVIRTE